MILFPSNSNTLICQLNILIINNPREGYEYKIHKSSNLFSISNLIKVAVNGEYIYFAGGGGGSTGIPNEIVLYTFI